MGTVDTTCPWVTKVWNVVDKQVAKGMTTVIHGKYAHEEAIATASYCDNYIMVKNIDEAEYVCRYILNPTPEGKEALLAKFAKAMSRGFDPDVHLAKVGLANQTTMYKKETQAIGKLFELTMIQKYPEDASDRFVAFDTICDATQVRQDAIQEMIQDPKVDEGDCILEDNSVKHRLLNGDVVIENDWLPTDRPLKIGVTSGASTPDAYVQDALER